jgi:acetoin utilization protein AcuC
MRQAAFVYAPRFKEYDLGPSHPMRPLRVVRTYELVRACHLLEGDNIVFASPSLADEDQIALIHSQEYIDAVRAPSEGRPMPRPAEFGFGTVDNPIVRGLYQASALIVGGSVQAVDLVVDGKVSAAFNPAGGLHHAHHARAAGFCVFNDLAIAIAHLLRRCGDGVKVAYVDIDAHHGDGVQEAFYSRRDVLTISVHESGRFLFPGTGYPDEIGEGEGAGFSVNLPLAPNTTDEVYLWAFREAVLPILEAFGPDFVVTQLGADTHYRDPLTHMCLTTHGYASVVDEIAARAPRWIATGGGGYDVTVVPRAWTLAFARMAEVEAPEHIPSSEADPYRILDGPPPLHDQHGPKVSERQLAAARHFAEEVVKELQERVFPYHGLAHRPSGGLTAGGT